MSEIMDKLKELGAGNGNGDQQVDVGEQELAALHKAVQGSEVVLLAGVESTRSMQIACYGPAKHVLALACALMARALENCPIKQEMMDALVPKIIEQAEANEEKYKK